MPFSGLKIKEIVERSRAFAAAMGARVDPLDADPYPLPFINIEPWTPANVRPNSVDLTLSDDPLRRYDIPRLPVHQLPTWIPGGGGSATDPDYVVPVSYLDPYQDNPTVGCPWGEIDGKPGELLIPGNFYLASTVERTETHGCVPWIEGRSSWGRLGLHIHVTAGFGDDGFCGRWTLELVPTLPVLVRPGMRICQVAFAALDGERAPYSGRYQNQTVPTASRLHLG